MIRDIYLYGAVGQLHGSHFRIDVASPAEAVRALITLRPGLREQIRQGAWRVIVGPPHLRNAIDVDQLNMNVGSQPIHLVPAQRPAGGGDGKSIGAIIIGVVLIATAIALPFLAPVTAAAITSSLAGVGLSLGSVALMGASLVLGGISALLTVAPDAGNATDMIRSDDRPSFLFNGVSNSSQQGSPVPVVLGRHMTGSVVVFAGLSAEDIA